MMQIQIQLPEALYRQLKRVARERKMSRAEMLRHGAEAFQCRHPETPPGDEVDAARCAVWHYSSMRIKLIRS